MAETPKPEELFDNIDHSLPDQPWEDLPPDLSDGRFCYPTKKKNLE
jgi:hypothetical protein